VVGALDEVLKDLEWLKNSCDGCDLPMTKLQIERMLRTLNPDKRDEPHQLEVVRAVNGILSRMRDEMSLRLFLYVPEASRELLMNRQPFGETVWLIFPEAIGDVEEAAKCLALQRATATVFHCMRVVEFALRTLIVKSFGDTKFFEGDSIWGRITNRIRKEANKKDTDINPVWAGKQGRLNHLAMLINQVGEAFRDPTMHCERTYTLEEAKDVFQSTGTFMRRLAEEISGKGTDHEEVKAKPKDAKRPRHPDSNASGLSEESQADYRAYDGITPPQPEEGLGTSPSDHSAGCTAKRTRSDRTEDA
jgi:hypothetical protein